MGQITRHGSLMGLFNPYFDPYSEIVKQFVKQIKNTGRNKGKSSLAWAIIYRI